MRGPATAAIALAAALTALEAPLNARLGTVTTELTAALVAFAAGAAVLAVIVTARGELGRLRSLGRLPPQLLLGGLCGATFVTVALASVESIGAGGIAAAAITGQLGAAVTIDRAGLLGLTRRPVSARRMAGVLMLVLGTLLIVGTR